ncbi:MAG: sialate O-acetylesterase [Sphingobacteriaceae bacterium]
MKYLFPFFVFFFISFPAFLFGSTRYGGQPDTEKVVSNKNSGTGVVIITPQSRIVYQRRNDNKTLVPVKGAFSEKVAHVEARLVVRKKGQGKTSKWQQIKQINKEGTFSGNIEGYSGWYDLEVRCKTDESQWIVTKVERVGIGEVFIVVGHSVAQGGEINGEGATDDRVSTVALDEKLESFDKKYLTTADPAYLPDPVFVQAATGIAQAPFGHGNYFWSKFAELVVEKENVPVLLFNAAFGGTSLEHWSKSSQNIQFEHGFVRSAIRMPYINLLNTFNKYVSLTGLRALLADQGQNDGGQKDANIILSNYKTFVQQAREDLNFPKLEVVVNQQMPKDAPAVRKAQESMIKQPYCFPGPDYDKDLLEEDHVDGIHLSISGVEKAAHLWSNALTSAFFNQVEPWLPTLK